jgi:hypothetical protein
MFTKVVNQLTASHPGGAPHASQLKDLQSKPASGDA